MSGRILIGGIGNVLLGDDAIGPYVIRLLESQYTFGDDVEIMDLGTPALDLTHRIVGLHAVILVDCVTCNDHPHGSVLLYRKEDILRIAPAQRLDPHSPALAECLLSAEMLGASPEHVMLIGIVGARFEPGCMLTSAVEKASAKAVHAILSEMDKLNSPYQRRESNIAPNIWWIEHRGADQSAP